MDPEDVIIPEMSGVCEHAMVAECNLARAAL